MGGATLHPAPVKSLLQRGALLLAHIIDRSSSRTAGMLVLLIGLLISVGAWQSASTVRNDAARVRFNGEAERLDNTLQRRLVGQEQILRGGAGLFNVNNNITRAQWSTYVSSLNLEDNYTGVQGMGFSLRIAPERRQALEAAIRAEGYPEFSIRPATPREEYHSIIYLEPLSGRNLRAFGYDMSTETTRRNAMNRARDTGAAALSGRVELVQETKQDVQPGYLMYYPVYRTDMPRATEAQRRDALLGFTYMPLRARDMITPLLSQYAADVGTEIFDGKDVRPEALLYSNRITPAGTRPVLEKLSRIEFAGGTWTLRHTAQPAFAAAIDDGRPGTILAIGLLLTVMFSGAVWTLAWTRNRAYSLAGEMTKELSRSESRLKTIVETAPDAIITLDAEGIVASVNRAAESIFGRAAEGMPGSHISCLIPELHGRQAMARLSSQGQQRGDARVAGFEGQALHGDGRNFPISISLGEFDDAGRRHLSFIVRDISTARRAAADLHLRDRALESSGNGVVIADMRLPDEPIIYCNPAFERISGYRRNEVLGRNCRFLQGGETEQAGVQAIRQALANGQPCNVVLRNYRKDGTAFWNELAIAPVLDARGVATHFVGVQNDITARVQASNDLLLRQQRLDAVFSLSPDGFVGFDANGELSLFNPAFSRMTGFGEADLTGLTEGEFDGLMRGLCDPAQANPAVDALPSPGGDKSLPTPVAILTLLRPTRRILQRSVRKGADGLGEKVYYFRDVTHETEVDRMKSEFLSTAAHELRTPMASIFGYSELLLTRDFDTETRHDIADTIHRQTRILTDMVDELLDLARIEARAGKDFRQELRPLLPIIRDTVDNLLIRNDPRSILVDLPDTGIRVSADGAKLGQALTNVLANAYKYSPAGGDIRLTLIQRRLAGQQQVGICVRDEGIGMTPETLARVFERFYRADPSGNIPGTGLGMSLVKEILEIHGGAVDVASEPGTGTAVTLWLPQAPSADLILADVTGEN